MGSWYYSVHIKTNDARAVQHSAASAAKALGTRMFVTSPINGWINIYPQMDCMSQPVPQLLGDHLRETAPSIEHVIELMLADSGVFSYEYVHHGRIADRFVSCPDYFDEASEEDLAAVGNPDAFMTLLDAENRDRLRVLISARMINGEDVGGESPVFEDERHGEMASLLGIRGSSCNFDLLKRNEETEWIDSTTEIVEIG